MSDCWVCKQKAEYRLEKLKTARESASKKAQDEQKTMAIWKEGCQYKYGEPESAGSNKIIEYISQYPKAATT